MLPSIGICYRSKYSMGSCYTRWVYATVAILKLNFNYYQTLNTWETHIYVVLSYFYFKKILFPHLGAPVSMLIVYVLLFSSSGSVDSFTVVNARFYNKLLETWKFNENVDNEHISKLWLGVLFFSEKHSTTRQHSALLKNVN